MRSSDSSPAPNDVPYVEQTSRASGIAPDDFVGTLSHFLESQLPDWVPAHLVHRPDDDVYVMFGVAQPQEDLFDTDVNHVHMGAVKHAEAPVMKEAQGGTTATRAAVLWRPQRLAGADLMEMDFSDGEYKRADFSGANLTRARLQGTRLDGANLRGACLRNADLSKAVMSEADGEGANLFQAGLTEVDATGANLCGVNAYECRFDRAHLQRARLDNGVLFAAALVGADLSHACLRGADLRRADLTKAILTGANVENARFDQVRYDAHTRWPAGVDPRLVGAEFIAQPVQSLPAAIAYMAKATNLAVRAICAGDREMGLRQLESLTHSWSERMGADSAEFATALATTARASRSSYTIGTRCRCCASAASSVDRAGPTILRRSQRLSPTLPHRSSG